MKISKKCEYAIYAIIDLCQQPENSAVPISDISRRKNIPMPFLEQIMLILKSGGIVKSRRGSSGGFTLNRTPDQITMGQVLKLIDGPVTPVSVQHDHVTMPEDIILGEIWNSISTAVNKVINNVTFAELVRRIKESHEYNYII